MDEELRELEKSTRIVVEEAFARSTLGSFSIGKDGRLVDELWDEPEEGTAYPCAGTRFRLISR